MYFGAHVKSSGGVWHAIENGVDIGVPRTSPRRDVSTRFCEAFHSPHQSSSRTVGQTPSIMYDFWLIGESVGPARRHCPAFAALASTPAFARS